MAAQTTAKANNQPWTTQKNGEWQRSFMKKERVLTFNGLVALNSKHNLIAEIRRPSTSNGRRRNERLRAPEADRYPGGLFSPSAAGSRVALWRGGTP